MMRTFFTYFWILSLVLCAFMASSVAGAQTFKRADDTAKELQLIDQGPARIFEAVSADGTMEAITFEYVYIAQFSFVSADDSYYYEDYNPSLSWSRDTDVAIHGINLSGERSFVRLGIFAPGGFMVHHEDSWFSPGSRRDLRRGWGIGAHEHRRGSDLPSTFIVYSDRPLHLDGVIETSEVRHEGAEQSRALAIRELTFTQIDCDQPGYEWVCSSWFIENEN